MFKLNSRGEQNTLQTVLFGLLIVAAFFIGMLWTKVQSLEGTSGNNTANAVAPTNNAPTPTPAAAPTPTKAVKDLDKVSNADFVRGDRKARIALIEYSDLECPFCKRFHTTGKEVVEAYKNDVMWVYRHFPLDQLHSKARKEAEASECAAKLGGNDKFWAYIDKVYEISPTNNGLDLAKLPEIAQQVGLNVDSFKKCLDSGEMASAVESDYQSGIKAGVTGTPGNILFDTKTGKSVMLPGAVPFATIKTEIDNMLAE